MSTPEPSGLAPSRRLFWGSVWLAILLSGVKAYHLGIPPAVAITNLPNYIRSLAAISYVDVIFAAVLWAVARAALHLAGARARVASAIAIAFLVVAAICVIYSVANIVLFGLFGGFVTYPLLALVGNVRMLGSSVKAHLTAPLVLGLLVVPVSYVSLVEASARLVPGWAQGSRHRRLVVMSTALLWVALGQYAFTTEWATRQDRKVSANPQWVLASSWWQAVSGGLVVRMTDQFAPGDLDDFEPIGSRPPTAAAVLQRIKPKAGRRTTPARPPNVILLVLESVAARWTSLYGGPYPSTPVLQAELAHAMRFDRVYAHIGRSSNSLLAILLSLYPKLDFRDVTDQYPRIDGTSVASVFHDRGYRTAFVTSSDISWASWNRFLPGRGFDDIKDRRALDWCKEEISSWGVEDRCMVDAMVGALDTERGKPFFLMGWTTQTHHPYEPTPGVPLIDMEHEPVPDQYNLGRYLNVLHETDRHIGRLFAALRERHLESDTIVVITGDHGQAFGYPHDDYVQGRSVYEEDVHVPFVVWSPKRYPKPVSSVTVGSHVDVAPTIAELAGLPAAPDWQGRSLFDQNRSGRAYFYVAEDSFTLGVREGRWKYIYDLRQGTEALYDLDGDPNEQANVAPGHRDLCTRLRQRLAAWTEANRRQYGRVTPTGTPGTSHD